MSSFFSLSLLAVIVAALLDIVANLLLAKSQGFRRKFIGFASLGMVGLAFYALSLAVRDMDLAVATPCGAVSASSGRPSAAGSCSARGSSPARGSAWCCSSAA